MNFHTPILLSLFEKLIKKTPRLLRIQEMLPNSEQLLKINNKKHVSEFVLQWNGKRNKTTLIDSQKCAIPRTL